MKRPACLVALYALLMLSMPVFAEAGEEDNISEEVQCRRMDRRSDDYRLEEIGHVGVYGNQQAAQNCNQAFPDCGYRCVACIYNYQHDGEVCEDRSGNRFLN
ncbi:hypothetical protein F6R98_11625 [Candidatus Methylospira mobilis]|uniref:Uncharacterized protein n=1 Tax=Candidatus Methylospira mobilis TaxID=1808979 RepID=A0A5Q0BM56_9GAMM|nr:hypothetical protein [Candidatus Methylospira mobilis]QFY43187.1 hypothetical protein F6R98_11625 [Candidatus Methylospira mobilis]